MKASFHNILFILLLIILFSINVFAQLTAAGRLRQLIAKETNDTIKIKILIQLALTIPESDPEQDTCFKLANELSRKNKYSYGLAYGHYYEGLLLSRTGKYEEAIIKYKSSIDELDSLGIIQSINDPLSTIRFMFNMSGNQEEKFRYYTDKLIFYKNHGPIENTAYCYHGIAGYYHNLADYDKAIGYYLRALNMYIFFDSLGCANEKQAIGSLYLEWRNPEKAEEYLQSALNDLISLNENCFYSYHQLGNLYFFKQEYRKSLQYYFKGRQYCTIKEYTGINLINCAAVYLELDIKDSALFYLMEADKIRQKEGLGLVYSNGEFDIDFNFYKYYAELGNIKFAKQRLKAALFAAQSFGHVPLILKYSNELSSFLLKNGDSIESILYLKLGQTIQDSLNKMNTQARIATFEIEQQQQQQENEIEELQTQKATQRNYYLIGGALVILIAIGLISRLRYKRQRDKEQLQTEFKKQLAQAETKALRSQMNPHFIFNSLNSINSFVIEQKHELASDYLIKFSKLIRLILDNSQSETISIEKELETLKLYVLLEAARFDNKFKCIYDIAEDVNTNSIMIPPMLLQPFVENAIWHGLMQKEGEGTITIEIKKEDEEFLNISITDDGIGREKAAELKSKSATHKSHGLKVTSQRIEMMNKLNSTGAQVHIFDLKDEKGEATGTKVELIIPY